jgi:DNA-binding XRE family transcriptional regulator
MDAKKDKIRLLVAIRAALGHTQETFAPAIGSSQRTIGRWETGKAPLYPRHWATLAKVVHPEDSELAAQAAEYAGETLVSLGLEPDPAAVAASAAPQRSSIAPHDLVDIVVLAGVAASGGSPGDVRRWVHAVVKRASDIGLSVEEVEEALRPQASSRV